MPIEITHSAETAADHVRAALEDLERIRPPAADVDFSVIPGTLLRTLRRRLELAAALLLQQGHAPPDVGAGMPSGDREKACAPDVGEQLAELADRGDFHLELETMRLEAELEAMRRPGRRP